MTTLMPPKEAIRPSQAEYERMAKAKAERVAREFAASQATPKMRTVQSVLQATVNEIMKAKK
jgi:hypothetical protein